MAGGASAGSALSGFGKAFASVLLGNRVEQRRRQERDEDMRLRADQQMLPIALNLGSEYGDWTLANEVVGRMNPDLANRFKREGSPFDVLGPMLSRQVPGQPTKVTEINKAGLPFESPTGPPTLPSTQGVIATQPVSERTHFLGQRMPTQIERRSQALQADYLGELDALRSIARNTGMPLEVVMDRYGRRLGTTAGGGSISPARLFQDQLNRRQVELKRPLTSEEVAEERQKWESLNDTPRSLGIYAERAASTLGFSSAAEAARAGRMDDVNALANELAGGQAGAQTAARVTEQAKSPQARFQALTTLQDDWRKANAPLQEMRRQYSVMQSALNRFREDPAARGPAAEALRIAFVRMTEPTSVVMPSEFARGGQGLALVSRVQGFIERLAEGGAGIPDAEMAAMVETARQFLEGLDDWNALERDRITEAAKEYNLDPQRVFGRAPTTGDSTIPRETAPPAQTNPAAPGQPTAQPQNAAPGASKDANGNWRF